MMKPSTDDKNNWQAPRSQRKHQGERSASLPRNPDLEADGRAEKNAGKVQNWIGKVEKAVGE